MDLQRTKRALAQALKDEALANDMAAQLVDVETDEASVDALIAVETELTTLAAVQTSLSSLATMETELAGGAFSVDFTVGMEGGGDDIVVAVQAYDEAGTECAVAVGLTFYLVTTAAAVAFETDDYTIAAGTNGALVQPVADNVIEAITEADGTLDISLTIAGAASCFLAWKGPTGKLTVSDEILHAV